MRRSRLDGKKFGKLTVLKFYDKDKWNNSRWVCECECGNITIVRGYALNSGHSRTCGCSREEEEEYIFASSVDWDKHW